MVVICVIRPNKSIILIIIPEIVAILVVVSV